METVIIINHKLYDEADSAVIREVSEFFGSHSFKMTESLVDDYGMSYLETKFHKYFPAQGVYAENYDLINKINECVNNDTIDWYQIKDDYKEFITNIDTSEHSSDNDWYTGLFSLDKPTDGEDHGSIDIPLLGVSVTFTYQQRCDKYLGRCDTKR